MFPDPTLTLADQILWIVAVFMKTMAAEGCKRRIGLFSVAIWSRVKRFERRFLALYAEWKAGTLPKARVVRAKDTSPRPSSAERRGGERHRRCRGLPRLIRGRTMRRRSSGPSSGR